MTIKERIDSLAALGTELMQMADDADYRQVVAKAYAENRWFTPENIHQAVTAIAETFLQADKLLQWAGHYPISTRQHPEHTIALVMAGNIPTVGFHDWLCVFVAGHRAKIKLSDKDKHLFPFLIKKLGDIQFETWEYTEFLDEQERLSGFDAVIATGSNNTTRYFEQYFAKFPHIIRGNRNSVAVLDGTENEAELLALGVDIFSYFGLGCRNVSKLYVPAGYDFNRLLEVLHHYRELANHDKYRNNFDFNVTLFVMNNSPYLNNGCLILRENPALQTRISCVHYEYYQDISQLKALLQEKAPQIQCIVGKSLVPGLNILPLGASQKPELNDYADGIDTLQFLTGNFI